MRTNVTPEHMLNLLLLEAAFDDKARRAIDRTGRTHFREHELNDVLWLPMHPLADVGDVRKNRLLVTLTRELRRRDGVPPPCGGQKSWVCCMELNVEAAEELKNIILCQPPLQEPAG
jgi:hypothetical protein